MQDLLTTAAAATAVFTLGYTVISFAAYAWNRAGAELRQRTAALEPPVEAPLVVAPPAPEPVVEPQRISLLDSYDAIAQHITQVQTGMQSADRQTYRAVGEFVAAAVATADAATDLVQALPPALPAAEPPLTSLGVRELRQRCKAAGIKGASRLTKAQCLAALEPPVGAPRVVAPPTPEPRIRRRRRAA